MGNPKGSNAGTVGKKGRSGRKSAFEEHKIAEIIKEAFLEGVDYQALKETMEKLKDGSIKKVRLLDIALAKATRGDAILNEMLRKLMPDKIEDVTPEKKDPVVLLLERMKALSKIKKTKPVKKITKKKL